MGCLRLLRVYNGSKELSRACALLLYQACYFEALSYSHKKEYVDWIDGAKRAATRERRIAKAQEMLRAGTTPKGR